jgi:hypothetical protein
VKKSGKQLEREIASFLEGDSALYWPGGSGGGGSRRRVKGTPVVRPHARTSPSCRHCGQFHTTAEHELESGGAPTARASRSNRSRSKATQVSAKASRVNRATSTGPSQVRSPAVAQARSPMEVVRDAVTKVRGPGRFGDRKVFVSALWDRVGDELGISLAEFKRWLVAQHQAGALRLARADLVAAMDPELVERSEIRDRIAEFHFVVDPEVKDRW